MTEELYRLSANEAVLRLRQGKVTPLDLIDAVGRRWQQVNRAVNALVTPCFDRARDHARRLMALPAERRGLLDKVRLTPGGDVHHRYKQVVELAEAGIEEPSDA